MWLHGNKTNRYMVMINISEEFSGKFCLYTRFFVRLMTRIWPRPQQRDNYLSSCLLCLAPGCLRLLVTSYPHHLSRTDSYNTWGVAVWSRETNLSVWLKWICRLSSCCPRCAAKISNNCPIFVSVSTCQGNFLPLTAGGFNIGLSLLPPSVSSLAHPLQEINEKRKYPHRAVLG